MPGARRARIRRAVGEVLNTPGHMNAKAFRTRVLRYLYDDWQIVPTARESRRIDAHAAIECGEEESPPPT